MSRFTLIYREGHREGLYRSSLSWGREGRALVRVDSVAIVGVGLIGGSIGLCSKTARLRLRSWGWGVIRQRLTWPFSSGRSIEELRIWSMRCPRLRLWWSVRRSAGLPTTCGAAESAPAGVLVTDAGSSKRQIVETVERHPRSATVFVGAHPLAGSERRGAEHARADLFDGRVCVLTPTPRTRLDRTRNSAKFLGRSDVACSKCRPPSMMRSSLIPATCPMRWPPHWHRRFPPNGSPLAAGAYRDGTRVAAADTGIWTAIFRDNRGPLLKALGTLQERLDAFKYALMTDDEQAIRQWWIEARERRGLFDAQLDSPDPTQDPAYPST